MTRSYLKISIFLSALFIAGNPSLGQAESMPLPMDGESLAATSGMGETTGIAETNSVISNNTIGDVGYTGGIANISASNNSGLTTLIENTGNQVSISTATVVNVNFH